MGQEAVRKKGKEGGRKKKERIIFYKLFVARKDSWYVFVQESTPVTLLNACYLPLNTKDLY